MSRNGITYRDVVQCAEALIAHQEEPTIERIRIQLGTGSNSTIGTHLRAWRAKQDDVQRLVTKEKLPEELIRLLKGLWERVMAQADEQIVAITHQTQHELTQLKQQIKELQQSQTQLQQSESRLKQACDGYAQEKSVLEQIINQTRSELVALQAKQEGSAQQLAEKQTRIDELHQHNKQVQANLEHYRAAALEQREQEKQRSEYQVQELTQVIQQLKIENESLQQNLIQWQKEYGQLQSTETQLHSQLEKLTVQNQEQTTELLKLTASVAQKTASEQHWKTQHNQLASQWEEQHKITALQQTQQGILLNQVTLMKEKLDDLTQQNKALAHEKWILGQEKAQLYGQLKQLQSCV